MGFLLKKISRTTTLLIFLGVPLLGHTENQVISLDIGYKTVHFTGRAAQAIAINNQIPGPILHFKEGDHVTIDVHNHLNKGTAVHWHGVLVPWQMDGVENLTQKPIPPEGVFHYRFTLHQSGTYWYHAHAGFQEQSGLYGAIIIDPLHPSAYHYDKDFVVILSDWNDTPPDQVYDNLKKTGDYYASQFPLQASLSQFIQDYRRAPHTERINIAQDYHMMQKMRMGIYDISDVAYDRFLLNGTTPQKPWKKRVRIGDIVRLRFIDAGGSSVFHVKIPETPMQVVHIDGNDVKPYSVKHFTLAPGETYDVLVKITQDHPYRIYAESADTLGYAAGALITRPHHVLNFQNISHFPTPKPFSMEGSADHRMMSMDHESMNRDHHPMSTSQEVTHGTAYQALKAAVKTNDPQVPIEKIIRMNLSGFMDRYIWFINGVPEYQAKPIVLKPGKRYRFIFTNHAMMHHPMHIHGHWFILRNGHGAYDPLLHTIDMPPHSTAIADVDTDASGQWFFHCHQLYHMMAGMARVIQYSTLLDLEKGTAQPENIVKPLPYANRAILRVDQAPIDFRLVTHPSAHGSGLFLANFLEVDADPFNNTQEMTIQALWGSDYNKLELYANEMTLDQGKLDDANLDVFYWRLISQFWAFKGGANYVYHPAHTPYWQPGIGLEGLMPYFIDTNLRTYYHSGGAKLDLELSRDTQITHRFFIRTGVRGIFASKTVNPDEVGSGFNELELTLRPYYPINPTVAVYLQYQYTNHYGKTRQLLQENNENTEENNISLGLSFIL